MVHVNIFAIDDSDKPPHFRSQVIALMVELFLIGAGYAIYLILITTCARFVIQISRARPRARIYLSIYLFASFVSTSLFLLVQYATESNLLLCSLDSSTPLFLCENPSVDGPARTRYKIVISNNSIVIFLADAMLVSSKLVFWSYLIKFHPKFYRAGVIWQWNIWLAVPSAIFLLGSTAFQIYIYFPLNEMNPSHTTAAWFLSAGYDIVMSSLIVARLLYHRRNAKMAGNFDSVYTSLISVFFEASLLNSSVRIVNAAIETSAISDITARWPQALNAIGAALAPLLIILRLALHAFVDPYSSKKTAEESEVIFRSMEDMGRNTRTIFFGHGDGHDISLLSTPDTDVERGQQQQVKMLRSRKGSKGENAESEMETSKPEQQEI